MTDAAGHSAAAGGGPPGGTSGEEAVTGTGGTASENRPATDERGFEVFRLRFGHVLAFVAALALLFIMAGDWYSTGEGVRAREIQHSAGKGLPGWGMIDPGVVDDAKLEAEKAERNAWQVSSILDALVLAALLATVGLAIASAALQAAGRTFDPRRSPSAAAGGAAALAFLLVVAQAAARLGPSSDNVFQVGLPLGIMSLGAIALGSATAVRDALSEREHAGSPPRAGAARFEGREDQAAAGAAAGGPATAGAPGRTASPGAPGGAEAPPGATYNRAR